MRKEDDKEKIRYDLRGERKQKTEWERETEWEGYKWERETVWGKGVRLRKNDVSSKEDEKEKGR